jgi:plastocyanin
MFRRSFGVLAAVLAATLVLAACGGDGDDEGDGATPAGTATETQTPSEDGGGGADLTVVDFGFSPADLTVSEGQTITIANIGDTSHTFTTEDGSIDETIGAGEEVEVTLEGVSSGGFRCRFHSQMQGTLTVQ